MDSNTVTSLLVDAYPKVLRGLTPPTARGVYHAYHASSVVACEACGISTRVSSAVVALLAQRPEAELMAMQSKLDAEHSRIELERAKNEFESEQVAQALALQKRRMAPKPGQRSGRRASRPGATQKRILDAVAALPQPVSPAQIIAEMESRGTAGNRGTIHNAIGRLVKTGVLDKIDVGQYQLASRNGSSAESRSGPTENETSEPLLTAEGPQEGT